MTIKSKRRPHQDFVIRPERFKPEPKGQTDSWWTRMSREDFTAVARVMVKPETRTNYSRPMSD